MKNRFTFQPRLFCFWLAYFILARLLFLGYQYDHLQTLSPATVGRVLGYGLRLDASAAAYLCVVPFVLFLLGSLAGPRFPLGRLVGFPSAVAGVVVTFMVVSDLELYRAWGFRLDATPLQYLNTPTEMLASAGTAPWAVLLALFSGLLLFAWLLYKNGVGALPAPPAGFGRGRAVLVSLLYLLLLVVPLRGGVQQIPVNQSDVYFSSQPFANHAALNVAWNVVNSLLQQGGRSNPYRYLPDTTAQRQVAQLYPATATPFPHLLRVNRPNVLFVILESFTAKLVGSLGGEAGVTPTLDSLRAQSVSFSSLYAAGDRSQKGLVALLSGYPNQPTTSIIKHPRKTENLPQLCRTLKAQGYSSHYYYGGELAFANMKSYLVAGGYDQLTERADFPVAEQNSKWGAHDHVLFRRMLRELRTQRQPFFVTAFTLSSHEPFEVPMPPHFTGTTEADLFRNSVYYTDHALGQFLQQARQQPWWNNTLVVLVADHGHPLPGNSYNDAPAKFHIPLLLTGGALLPSAKGKVVPELGSQTDVAATLLAQLGLPDSSYRFSRNLLQPTFRPFAFYCYTDGFGLLTPQDTIIFDNAARQVSHHSAGALPRLLQLGKAYQQVSYEDFLRR